MVSYSAWTWSQAQQKYYSAVYDDDGEIVEYHWEGGHRQYVQRTKPPGETPSAEEVADDLARLSVSGRSDSHPRTVLSAQQPSSSSVHAAATSSQSYQQPGSTSTTPNYTTSTTPTITSPYAHNTSPTLNYSSSSQTNTAHQSSVNSYFDSRNSSRRQHESPPDPHNASPQQHLSPQQHTPSQTYPTSQQHSALQSYPNSYQYSQSQQYPPTPQQYTSSQPWHNPQAHANSQQYTQPHTQQHAQQQRSQQQHMITAQSSQYIHRSVTSPSATLPEEIQETVGGNLTQRHIRSGDDGSNYERLHPSFKRIPTREHDDFFCRGRVFKMLWTEPAGMVNPGGTRGSTHYSLVRFNEGAYSEIRRFVVIQNKGNFSQCIPIQSYRGQGATKHGLVVGDHAIIYTGFPGARPPTAFAGEENMLQRAIRVHPYRSESLNAASRINFGKPYAVEHNVKLAEIGIVADEHLHILATYFMRAMGLPTN